MRVCRWATLTRSDPEKSRFLQKSAPSANAKRPTTSDIKLCFEYRNVNWLRYREITPRSDQEHTRRLRVDAKYPDGRQFNSVASYDEVRRASPKLADIEGCSLLIELYRDTLFQIKGWLDDIADILNHPITELERRGLPTKGEVNIPINLRPPEELEMLKRWVNQRTSGLKADSRTVRGPHQQSPSRGLWTGFGLGLLVGLD